MPAATTVANIITRPLPRMVSANSHRIADYVIASSFFAVGTGFLATGRRRAGTAALFCGGCTLALSLLTSYPGRRKRLIPMELHRRLEPGLAAMVATLPEFLSLSRQGEKPYFRFKAGLITALSNLSAVPRRRS